MKKIIISAMLASLFATYSYGSINDAKINQIADANYKVSVFVIDNNEITKIENSLSAADLKLKTNTTKLYVGTNLIQKSSLPEKSQLAQTHLNCKVYANNQMNEFINTNCAFKYKETLPYIASNSKTNQNVIVETGDIELGVAILGDQIKKNNISFTINTSLLDSLSDYKTKEATIQLPTIIKNSASINIDDTQQIIYIIHGNNIKDFKPQAGFNTNGNYIITIN